jgi:hypothetical protein
MAGIPLTRRVPNLLPVVRDVSAFSILAWDLGDDVVVQHRTCCSTARSAAACR